MVALIIKIAVFLDRIILSAPVKEISPHPLAEVKVDIFANARTRQKRSPPINITVPAPNARIKMQMLSGFF